MECKCNHKPKRLISDIFKLRVNYGRYCKCMYCGKLIKRQFNVLWYFIEILLAIVILIPFYAAVVYIPIQRNNWYLLIPFAVIEYFGVILVNEFVRYFSIFEEVNKKMDEDGLR